MVEFNLETFTERTIFEKVTDSERSLLGIHYQAGDKWAFLQYHHGFFLNSTHLFFIGNDSVTQVNRLTGRIKNLEIPTAGNIAFDGRNIFFINARSELEKFDTLNGGATVYDGVIASDFSLDENTIYYINRMDSNHVYRCSLDGTHVEVLARKLDDAGDVRSVDGRCCAGPPEQHTGRHGTYQRKIPAGCSSLPGGAQE